MKLWWQIVLYFFLWVLNVATISPRLCWSKSRCFMLLLVSVFVLENDRFWRTGCLSVFKCSLKDVSIWSWNKNRGSKLPKMILCWKCLRVQCLHTMRHMIVLNIYGSIHAPLHPIPQCRPAVQPYLSYYPVNIIRCLLYFAFSWKISYHPQCDGRKSLNRTQ